MNIIRFLYTVDNTITFVSNTMHGGASTMAKYTQEIKDQAVEAAKTGMSLAEIQRSLGPNPKAVARYLAKAGIDYTALKAELKEAGKLKEPFNKQGKAKKQKPANSGSVEPVEEIIEE